MEAALCLRAPRIIPGKMPDGGLLSLHRPRHLSLRLHRHLSFPKEGAHVGPNRRGAVSAQMAPRSIADGEGKPSAGPAMAGLLINGILDEKALMRGVCSNLMEEEKYVLNLLLMVLFINQKDYQTAYEVCQEILASAPEDDASARLPKKRLDLDRREWSNYGPAEQYERYLLLTETLINQKKYKEAYDICQGEALKVAPVNDWRPRLLKAIVSVMLIVEAALTPGMTQESFTKEFEEKAAEAKEAWVAFKGIDVDLRGQPPVTNNHETQPE